MSSELLTVTGTWGTTEVVAVDDEGGNAVLTKIESGPLPLAGD